MFVLMLRRRKSKEVQKSAGFLTAQAGVAWIQNTRMPKRQKRKPAPVFSQEPRHRTPASRNLKTNQREATGRRGFRKHGFPRRPLNKEPPPPSLHCPASEDFTPRKRGATGRRFSPVAWHNSDSVDEKPPPPFSPRAPPKEPQPPRKSSRVHGEQLECGARLVFHLLGVSQTSLKRDRPCGFSSPSTSSCFNRNQWLGSRRESRGRTKGNGNHSLLSDILQGVPSTCQFDKLPPTPLNDWEQRKGRNPETASFPECEISRFGNVVADVSRHGNKKATRKNTDGSILFWLDALRRPSSPTETEQADGTDGDENERGGFGDHRNVIKLNLLNPWICCNPR
jgi:hypothetical protein